MQFKEVMQSLESMGTAQNRKVYARHGVGENMFGVSYSNLGKLQKKIKVDQALAEQLWASGNHDARVLASKIADPAVISADQLKAWVKDLDNYVISDAFAELVSKTPHARALMSTWTQSDEEWVGRTGWLVMAKLTRMDEELSDDFFESQLAEIEARIHQSKNRVRDAMNSALISIGLRNAHLEKLAVAAARRIGKVAVDHGETNCKTPDAVQYIKKAKEQREKRKKGSRKK